MIAHVAEKGEDRGRVVLQIGPSGAASQVAIDAALRVAQAYQSEIESLFIEDVRIIDAAEHAFAREISNSGRRTSRLGAAVLERELASVASALQRKIVEAGRRAEVTIRCRTVRGEPLQALATACAENGPWNVVALAQPLDVLTILALPELFQAVQGTTGVVVAGSRARRTSGPVVALIEEFERVGPMLRAAMRLAAVTGGDARLLITGGNGERIDWIEGQIRLALGEDPTTRITVAEVERGEPAAIAETLRRMGAGFVIAQFGGSAVPADGGLMTLAAGIEGPLFLVR